MEKKKRKLWKDSDMKAALQAVGDKSLTVTQAASSYNVPRKTLDDRVKGKVVHGTNPGRDPILTKEEEEYLCNYLFYMAERGFPLTRRMVMSFAWSIAERAGKASIFNPELGPGDHWWLNFRKRNPKVTLRKTDKLDRGRAECLDLDVVNDYFELLKKTLAENNLMHSPRCIYNCDESFLPLDGTREKAVTSVKAKHSYAQAHGTTDHITLLCGASAAGLALPPMIIFPKAFPGGSYTFKGPDDAVYAKSESGWVDSELFLSWMNKVFLPHAAAQRPLLLIIDGHKSHMTLDLVDVARANDVILFCLPPHTTHALQPLDVSVFKSLKDNFYKSVRALSFVKKNFTVSKRDFASVVKGPFEKSFSMSNIKAGFAKTGIFPFNPDAVEKSKMKPSECYQYLDTSTSSDGAGESTAGDESAESFILAPVTPSPVVSDCQQETTNLLTPPASDSSQTAPVPDSTSVADTPTSLTITPPQESSTPQTRSSATNPLVRAGLVPTHLADLFSTPETEMQPKKRRIVKARVLTENEYVEMMKEKDRKEKETEELKQKRKEEREKKRKEREKVQEEKRKERERKKEEREKAKQAKGNGKKRAAPTRQKRSKVPEVNGSESDGAGSSTSKKSKADSASSESEDEEVLQQKPKRTRQLPARFKTQSDSESSSESSGTECCICSNREPPWPACAAENIFWIDCDKCGDWVHCHCAFGRNASSRRYMCSKCA